MGENIWDALNKRKSGTSNNSSLSSWRKSIVSPTKEETVRQIVEHNKSARQDEKYVRLANEGLRDTEQGYAEQQFMRQRQQYADTFGVDPYKLTVGARDPQSKKALGLAAGKMVGDAADWIDQNAVNAFSMGLTPQEYGRYKYYDAAKDRAEADRIESGIVDNPQPGGGHYGASRDAAAWQAWSAQEQKNKSAQERLDQKNQEIQRALAYQQAIRDMETRNSVTGAADFEEYAQKGRERKNPSYAEGLAEYEQSQESGWHGPNRIQNKVTFSRDLSKATREKGENGYILPPVNGYDSRVYKPLYDYMTEEEVDIYSYLLAKEGEHAADAWLEGLMPTLAQRETQPYVDIAMQSGAGQVSGALESVADRVLGGIVTMPQQVRAAFGGDPVDPYSGEFALTRKGNALRQAVLSDDGEWQFLTGTSLSLLDFATNLALAYVTGAGLLGSGGIETAASKELLNTVTEVLSLSSMGAGAAADRVLEARQRGLSEQQASTLGIISGCVEMLTEMLSVDRLLSDPKSAVGYFLQNTATEGLEEGTSNLLNRVADLLVSADQNEIARKIEDYQRQGYDPAAAKNKAIMDALEDLGMDVLGGALSGAILSASTSIRTGRLKSGYAAPMQIPSGQAVEETRTQNTAPTAESVENFEGMPETEVEQTTVTTPSGENVTVTRNEFNEFFNNADETLDTNAVAQNGVSIEQLVERAEEILPDDVEELAETVRTLAKAKKSGKGGLPVDIQLFAAKRKLAWKTLKLGDIQTGDKTSRVYEKYSEDKENLYSDILSKKLLDDFLDRKGKYKSKSDAKSIEAAESLIATPDDEVKLYNEMITRKGEVYNLDDKIRAARILAQRMYDRGQQQKAVDLLVAVTRRGTEIGRAMRAMDLRIEDYSPVEAYSLLQQWIDFALSEELGTNKGSNNFYDVTDDLYSRFEGIAKDPAQMTDAEKEKAVKDTLSKIQQELSNKEENGKANRQTAKAIKKVLKSGDGNFLKLFNDMLSSDSQSQRRNAFAEFLGLAYVDADTQQKVNDLFDKLRAVDENNSLSDYEKTKQRYELTDQIYSIVAEKFPVSFREKLANYRKIAMLSNPKTHIKNFLSNVGNLPQRKLTEANAQLLEAILEKTGAISKEQRTQSLGWTFTEHGKSIADKVEADADREMLELSRISKAELGKENSNVFSRYRKIFKSKAAQNTISKIGDIESWLLQKGDDMFVKTAYRDALGQIMTARNATEITDEMRDIARERALIATFKAENALAKVANNIRRMGTAGEVIMNTIMPFTLTPTNIAMEAFRYSPVNVFVGAYKVASTIKNGGTNFEIAQAINSLAKGATGTAEAVLMLLVGWILKNLGIDFSLPTDYPKDDKGKSRQELTGSQQYSIKIGDKYIPLEWLQPAAFPIIFGAAANNAFNENGGNVLDNMKVALVGGYNSVTDMSVLQGVVDLFSQGDIAGGALEAVEGLPASMYPALFSAVTRSFDTQKRSTKGSNVLQRSLGKIGITSAMEPEVDIWGNPVYKTAAGDDWIGNALINMFSPSTITSGSEPDDELTQIILDLYDKGYKGAMPSTSISDWELSDGTALLGTEKGTEALKELGEKNREAAEWLINGNGQYKIKGADGKYKVVDWNSATEEEQAKILNSLFSGVKSRVKEQYEDTYKYDKVDPDVYNKFKIETQHIGADYYENGKTIQNSKKRKFAEYVDGLDVDNTTKYMLMEIAGYDKPDGVQNYDWVADWWEHYYEEKRR